MDKKNIKKMLLYCLQHRPMNVQSSTLVHQGEVVKKAMHKAYHITHFFILLAKKIPIQIIKY